MSNMTKAEINIEQAKIKLYGGTEFNFDANMKWESDQIAYIVGENGSGKTISLKGIAHIFNLKLDPVKDVKKLLSPSGINVRNIDISGGFSAFLHQNPANNLDNSPISDNIKDYLHRADSIDEEEIDEIVSLLREELRLSGQDLTRTPGEFSKGQQQAIAVALRLITQPELILLDEPFSRLSRNWTERILGFCASYASNSHIIASTHPQRLKGDPKGDSFHEVDGEEGSDDKELGIKISTLSNSKKANNRHLTNPLGGASQLEELLKKDSLEKAKNSTSNFKRLPRNNVICVSGTGKRVDFMQGEMSVLKGSRELTTCNLKVSEGLNVLIGDNGSGKTLVGKSLSGNINYNNFLLEGISRLTEFEPMRYNFKNNIYSSMKGEAYFIYSEPKLISKSTLLEEYKDFSSYGKKLFEEVMEKSSFSKEDSPASLSYGQRKMVQMCILPKRARLVVIDEPFGSLSTENSGLLSEYIIRHIKEMLWNIVVVTSNRPIITLKHLKEHAEKVT